MTARTPRNASATDAESTAEMAGAMRQPLASAAQSMATLLRAAEMLQQAHLQMLQRLALGQQQAADKLRQASSPPELMSVGSGLMVSGIADTTQYLQDLVLVGLKIQGELVGAAGQQQQGAAGLGTPNPMVQAWTRMFMAQADGTTATPTTH